MVCHSVFGFLTKGSFFSKLYTFPLRSRWMGTMPWLCPSSSATAFSVSLSLFLFFWFLPDAPDQTKLVLLAKFVQSIMFLHFLLSTFPELGSVVSVFVVSSTAIAFLTSFTLVFPSPAIGSSIRVLLSESIPKLINQITFNFISQKNYV